MNEVGNCNNRVFEEAAKLCCLREALINKISILNRENEDHFLTDEEYINQNSQLPEAKIWIWIMIVIATAFVLSVFARSQSAAQTIGIITIPLSILIYWLIRKGRKKSREHAVSEQLAMYHEKHQKFLEMKAEREKELEVLNHELEDVVDVLRKTQHQGIPEDYWDVGYVLWHYVVIGRADNRREAMNIYEEELRHMEMMKKLGQIDDLQREIRLVQARQAETAQRMEHLALRNEINSNINTMLTILEIRNS